MHIVATASLSATTELARQVVAVLFCEVPGWMYQSVLAISDCEAESAPLSSNF